MCWHICAHVDVCDISGAYYCQHRSKYSSLMDDGCLPALFFPMIENYRAWGIGAVIWSNVWSALSCHVSLFTNSSLTKLKNFHSDHVFSYCANIGLLMPPAVLGYEDMQTSHLWKGYLYIKRWGNTIVLNHSRGNYTILCVLAHPSCCSSHHCCPLL